MAFFRIAWVFWLVPCLVGCGSPGETSTSGGGDGPGGGGTGATGGAGGTTTPSTTSGTASTGSGGSGGAAGTGGVGGFAEICGDCDDDGDCYYVVGKPTSCAEGRCIESRCVEVEFSPVWVCGVIPGRTENAHCYGSQCCYTCLQDQGELGAIDDEDGPCLPGVTDTACGFGGGLCQDCTLEGMVCVKGACVAR